jgi:DNA-binding XRE family transcriptional regulator
MAEESLGARIRRLRLARGMTRSDLAAAMWALGMRTEQRDISRYESDVYEPKIHAFAALAQALGITVEALLYGEEEAVRTADECAGAGNGTARPGGAAQGQCACCRAVGDHGAGDHRGDRAVTGVVGHWADLD